MFRLELITKENYDETNNKFVAMCTKLLEFEHSLKSVSEWESKWKKPFLDKKEMTKEESISYLICMCRQQITEKDIAKITNDQMKKLGEYINDSRTATWFSNEKHTLPTKEVITSEVIYFWMVSLNIPLECENWHLNRLLTLIRVINEKTQPPKKMSKQELANRNRKLNAERCKKLNSKG